MILNHSTPAAALWMKYQELHEKQLSEKSYKHQEEHAEKSRRYQEESES